jgi:regulator of sigma E protease
LGGEWIGYIVMLGMLSVLIIVHECGHFSVARFFGFQTPVFGFGLPFGPHIVVGKKWGTEFRIHAALLGGYVAIPELGDESNKEAFGELSQPFRKFPIWQRALVAFAGVGFNILFAYLIMLVMLLALGEIEHHTTVNGFPGTTIASKGGVKVGDELVAVDDHTIKDVSDCVTYIGNHKSTLVHLHVLRDNKPLTIDLTTSDQGKVGMILGERNPPIYHKVQGNFFDAVGLAAAKLWDLTWSMLQALGQLVSGLFSGGKHAAGQPAVGWQDMHGVIAVVKIGADFMVQDWSQLFLFTIMISMDLAIINLVPWPALDGGHLAFMVFEAVRGRPMGERAQGEIVKWGFISLLALMAVIMVNDVTALVTGKLDFKKEAQKRQKEEEEKAKSAIYSETKPSDAKPGDVNPSDAKPSDAKPSDTAVPSK